MNKRAISAIIGYVLLISITLSLSVMVYNWLKFYVTVDDIKECPDDVNIIINSYECYKNTIGTGGVYGNLTITLKNKGLFTVDGYALKIHIRDDATFGLYLFNSTGSKLKPGDEVTTVYDFEDYIGVGKTFKDKNEFKKITLVEIQPFMNDKNGNMTCQSYTIQKINCN